MLLSSVSRKREAAPPALFVRTEVVGASRDGTRKQGLVRYGQMR